MIDIIWKSKIWFWISCILVLISVLSMCYSKYNSWSFLNFWLDFTGWAMMEITLEKEISKIELKEEIESIEKGLWPVIQSIWDNSYIIRTKEINDEKHTEIINGIRDKFWTLSENQFTSVWPVVWESMKRNAFTAIAVALVVIVLYISFVFRNLPEELSSWNFWFAAIIALTHDILITIWLFSIMWIMIWYEIDTLFITALLTVMWFSVHDTIVVFDRIRETIHKKSSWETFKKICNVAVNQTIRRSINTSVSVILPLLILYFFWSKSTSMFLLALIIWISIWTYSSIFLAAPFLVWISPKDELGEIKK